MESQSCGAKVCLVLLLCSESCPGDGCRSPGGLCELLTVAPKPVGFVWRHAGFVLRVAARLAHVHLAHVPQWGAPNNPGWQSRARRHCCMPGAPCCTAHPHCVLCRSRAPFWHVLVLDFMHIATSASAALQEKLRTAALLPFAFCTRWQQHFWANALETVLAGVVLRPEKPSGSAVVWPARGVVSVVVQLWYFVQNPICCDCSAAVRCCGRCARRWAHSAQKEVSGASVLPHWCLRCKTHICSAQRAVRARLCRAGSLLWQLQDSTSVSTETGTGSPKSRWSVGWSLSNSAEHLNMNFFTLLFQWQ